MQTIEVVVSVITTDHPRKKFVVRAAGILAAQIRVLSRIRGILQASMYRVRSARVMKTADLQS